MRIDDTLFRHVMSAFASGVTVVTSAAGEHLAGLTVSSFASLSLRPPLVLVCIHKRGDGHDTILQAGRFAVNVLNEHQEYLSHRFASQDPNKFRPASYTMSDNGLPLLIGVLAHIECRTQTALPGGDHTIFIGEVIAAESFPGRPLLYYHSGYHRLGEPYHS